jgi:hypothetical protein
VSSTKLTKVQQPPQKKEVVEEADDLDIDAI